ncbi:MAG: hypothetical protein KGJ80_01175 [Chloroflexota bacterium]|nr:hypothetical protein [Chloroflexota bacterium]
MKSLLNVVSVILILAGGVFFLQGIRILPSAVMYGKTEWVVIGAGMVGVGAALALFVNLRGAQAKC